MRSDVAEEIHVWPDYHGNRSPRADERLRGAVLGLRLLDAADKKGRFDELAKVHRLDARAIAEWDVAEVYQAHVDALALQTREMVEKMEVEVERVLLCGGLAHNPAYVRAHADALQLPVLIPGIGQAYPCSFSMQGLI